MGLITVVLHFFDAPPVRFDPPRKRHKDSFRIPGDKAYERYATNFFAWCNGRNCSRDTDGARVKPTLCCLLSTPIGSGLALSTIILCKQYKAGEHYAQC